MIEEMHDQIEAYFGKRMTPEEEATFKLRLQEDEAMRDMLMVYRIDQELIYHIQNQSKAKKIKHWQAELLANLNKRYRYLFLITSLFCVGVVGIALLLYNRKPRPTVKPTELKKPEIDTKISPRVDLNPLKNNKKVLPKIFSTQDRKEKLAELSKDAYLESYNQNGQRGDLNLVDSLYFLLNQSEYTTAKSLFEKIKQEEPASLKLDAAMLLGFSFFKASDYAQAKAYFQLVYDYPDFYYFKDKAEWYLTLCHFALGQDQDVRQILSRILTSSDHPYHSKALILSKFLEK